MKTTSSCCGVTSLTTQWQELGYPDTHAPSPAASYNEGEINPHQMQNQGVIKENVRKKLNTRIGKRFLNRAVF